MLNYAFRPPLRAANYAFAGPACLLVALSCEEQSAENTQIPLNYTKLHKIPAHPIMLIFRGNYAYYA